MGRKLIDMPRAKPIKSIHRAVKEWLNVNKKKSVIITYVASGSGERLMNEFKVGDKVRCIRAHPSLFWGLFIRKSYQIIDIGVVGDVRIKGHDAEEDAWWFPERFEKVVSNGKKR